MLVRWILAEGVVDNHELLESIRNAISSEPDPSQLVFLGVGIALLVLSLLIGARLATRGRNRSGEPPVDWTKVAWDTLGLDTGDRRCLERVAELTRHPAPAAMVLSPANLARAAERALAQGGEPVLREQLDRMCHKLFDVALPAETGFQEVRPDQAS